MTWKLEVEYLWIDSLCIVQDDEDQKARELPKMGEIFGNAYFVLAATLAENGDYGLYQERPRSSFTVLDSSGQVVKARAVDLGDHAVWKTSRDFWAADLPLFSRAWALQERLLARRVVHFTPYELVWECRTFVNCECGELLYPTMNVDPDFGDGKDFKTAYGDAVLNDGVDSRMKCWHDICMQYSAREITFWSDRLPAISSVARQIDFHGHLGRYLGGTWECTLPLGLLWQSACKENYGARARTHWRPRPYAAPTWSWLSINGWVRIREEMQKPLVRVLDIDYTLAGSDEYGPCSAGIIHIAGSAVPIEVVDAKSDEGCTEKEIRRPGDEDRYRFDTDTNPFEYSDDDLGVAELLALFFAGDSTFADSIVLKPVRGALNQYERLGIARCPMEWLIEHSTQVVVALV